VGNTASRRGLRPSIEFLPWTRIPDLATAWPIVNEAERDNAGILLDTRRWKRQPGNPAVDVLREIPGDRIPVLQTCGFRPEPEGDPMTECTAKRLLPGEGAVGFAGLDEIGTDPLLAPEVLNLELARAQPTAEQGRAATQSVPDR